MREAPAGAFAILGLVPCGRRPGRTKTPDPALPTRQSRGQLPGSGAVSPEYAPPAAANRAVPRTARLGTVPGIFLAQPPQQWLLWLRHADPGQGVLDLSTVVTGGDCVE